jgi:glutamate formiminotransferase/formiminotetrahydrofolate cyclodeaminase
MAAALCAMVAGVSRSKKNYLQYEAQLSSALGRLGELRQALEEAIDADAESFEAVMSAHRRAKQKADGESEIADALKRATRVPLEILERAYEVRDWAERLRAITIPSAASDLSVAGGLARAGVEGALANVRTNLDAIQDEGFKQEVAARLGKLNLSFVQGLAHLLPGDRV